MKTDLRLDILSQPDDTTCGPTCLHAVYRYYEDKIELPTVIAEIPMLSVGGTLGVLLACHALRRCYKVTIYTYNLQLFDPTWFDLPKADLQAKLRAQAAARTDERTIVASEAYCDFLDLGGSLCFDDLTENLLCHYLRRGVPVLTGLSATYLYRSRREIRGMGVGDDVRGQPTGHFVVLSGYSPEDKTVQLADPLGNNPISSSTSYEVSIDRVRCAILLGIVTYDANLLIIEPGVG